MYFEALSVFHTKAGTAGTSGTFLSHVAASTLDKSCLERLGVSCPLQNLESCGLGTVLI